MEHLPRAIPPGSSRERTELLLRLVPPESPDQMRPGYIKSLKHLLTLGITSFMEAYTSLDDEPAGHGGNAQKPRLRPQGRSG